MELGYYLSRDISKRNGTTDFEKAVNYKEIWYYRPEDDRFNTMKKAGYYMYSMGLFSD